MDKDIFEVQYDENGFDERGFHKDTKTQYDPDGYMQDGFNRNGWNRANVNKETRTYFDIHGFDINGIHEVTKKKQDENGFIMSGYNRRTKSFYGEDGFDIDGYDDLGFDRNGINKKTGTKYTKKGFDKDHHHKETGTFYDLEGFNAYGYDEEGYDRKGLNSEGLDREGFNEAGYNDAGLDRNGLTPAQAISVEFERERKAGKLDSHDFNKEGIHASTGTKYNYRGFDKEGFNEAGFDERGYDAEGFDEKGFNKNGINKETNTKYDPEGYDREGISELGFDRTGTIAPKLRLAIESIVFDNTPLIFSRVKNITTVDVKKALEYAQNYPNILEALDYTMNNSTVKYHYAREEKKNKILNNEITPNALYSIEKTLRECTPEELEVAIDNIYYYILSNDIGMMDYKRMFDLELDRKFIDNIKLGIKELFKKRKGNTGNKLHEVYKRIDGYKSPYTASSGEKIGYMDENGQMVMVEVTPEIREAASKYLKLIDEYECQKTMRKTMMSMIKGELTPDMIDAIEPKVEDDSFMSKEEMNSLVDDFIEDFKLTNNIVSKEEVKSRK